MNKPPKPKPELGKVHEATRKADTEFATLLPSEVHPPLLSPTLFGNVVPSFFPPQLPFRIVLVIICWRMSPEHHPLTDYLLYSPVSARETAPSPSPSSPLLINQLQWENKIKRKLL
jgi:hypothetical protein